MINNNIEIVKNFLETTKNLDEQIRQAKEVEAKLFALGEVQALGAAVTAEAALVQLKTAISNAMVATTQLDQIVDMLMKKYGAN